MLVPVPYRVRHLLLLSLLAAFCVESALGDFLDGLSSTLTNLTPLQCAKQLLTTSLEAGAKKLLSKIIPKVKPKEAVSEYTSVFKDIVATYKPVDAGNIVDKEQLLRYATFAGASYCEQGVVEKLQGLQLGPDHMRMLWDDANIANWHSSPGTNYFIAVSSSAKTVTVSFRGTRDKRDIVSFMDGAPVPPSETLFPGASASDMVFRGMQESASRLIPSVLTELKNQLDAHPDYQVVVTGHSLGGTYAKLFGLHLVLTQPQVKLAAVYTYAELASGMVTFSSWAARRIGLDRYVRVTMRNDIVPRLFQGKDGKYGHSEVGIEIYFPRADSTEMRRCDEISDNQCHSGVPCKDLSWDAHSRLGGFQMTDTTCVLPDAER
ncbi:Alpha/Beta hydrolase protein [Thamnocephalis sphaerospora]|uniref:Alpha/Beta hydrolase protein n=1 Tax=Thamnocephalis sphaerospora TaxID=78915 RepID=A0A4P9XM99_9FUNG|nr:Alpha/Beta hydrolase protein [Thamnocephalis sphaerospora]|eukprot:RKP07037.1 Alpha/Beta hydrolase protein [Thamnocephalis sphaerospora]